MEGEKMQKKIKITLCTGTSCYVMGAGELMLLDEQLPAHLLEHVEITASPCLNLCLQNRDERTQAPFVLIGEKVLGSATIEGIIVEVEKQLKEFKNVN